MVCVEWINQVLDSAFSGVLVVIKPNEKQDAIVTTSAYGLQICRGQTEFPLRAIEGHRFLIGSAPECDLQLGGDVVTGLHSQVHVEKSSAWIETVAAYPPLIINDERCRTACLTDGDRILIGPFELVWKATGEPVSSSSLHEDLPVNELVDRLGVELVLVDAHEFTVERGLESLQAALASVGDEPLAPVQSGDEVDVLAQRLNELAIQLELQSQRLDQREAGYAEVVATLLDSQGRLAQQVEVLISQLLERQASDDSLRASA